MKQQLDRRALAALLQAEEIEKLSIPELVALFREEKGVDDFLPDGFYEIDPRNGDRIIYHSSRARRPHDNRPSLDSVPDPAVECIICQGKTTGIVDVTELSEGFTFINKNLFPEELETNHRRLARYNRKLERYNRPINLKYVGSNNRKPKQHRRKRR